jgi:hypothetical protein
MYGCICECGESTGDKLRVQTQICSDCGCEEDISSRSMTGRRNKVVCTVAGVSLARAASKNPQSYGVFDTMMQKLC